jgi:hypothetical protein
MLVLKPSPSSWTFCPTFDPGDCTLAFMVLGCMVSFRANPPLKSKISLLSFTLCNVYQKLHCFQSHTSLLCLLHLSTFLYISLSLLEAYQICFTLIALYWSTPYFQSNPYHFAHELCCKCSSSIKIAMLLQSQHSLLPSSSAQMIIPHQS